MATKKHTPPSSPSLQAALPQGVRLVRTLRGNEHPFWRMAWSPDGETLAAPSQDGRIWLWNAQTGECLATLAGHIGTVLGVAFNPQGRILASAGADGTVRLWDVQNRRPMRVLGGHSHEVRDVSWSPNGKLLASGSTDGTLHIWGTASWSLVNILSGGPGSIAAVLSVAWDSESRRIASASFRGRIWEAATGKVLQSLNQGGGLQHVVWSPEHPSRWLATACLDTTIGIWDAESGKELRILEGHTQDVSSVSVSSDGQLLASAANDGAVRLWSCEDWRPLAPIPLAGADELAFHPRRPWLATTAANRGPQEDPVIHIWELDVAALPSQAATPAVTYTSAKIVLVGDSGVGKTGLGWHLAHGDFKEHPSTHGQQFWMLDQLRATRSDGAECEAILWDLAGQPDYRLIHALFLDDADLALVVFDPTRGEDPLQGVEFWLKQLGVRRAAQKGAAGSGPPTLLVAARADRGSARMTGEELQAYCEQRGLRGYLCTSAMKGEGIEALIQSMQESIAWDDKPATVTTATFKRIKDEVLRLKETHGSQELILTPAELRLRLEMEDASWRFTDEEMMTAVGHLAKHGYVNRLKTSRGEPRILLVPELLNNLAASFVLEARRNPKGLGSLEEQRLLAGEYDFPELRNLPASERDILLDSAAVMFLEHNVCFRETDPLNARAYLVFPELINLKKPALQDDVPVEDGVAYTVSGAVENVYASLVVLLGYTHTFTRTSQWRNQAHYEVGNGLVCGFRQEAEREGELDFVLYFGTTVGAPIRTLFQSLFESFLARRNLTVLRYEPVMCSKKHPLNRAVVREQMTSGADFAFCPKCGERLAIPKVHAPIQLTRQQEAEVEAQRSAADQRSRFEQVLFLVNTYVKEQKLAPPECFISYAWGNPEHERWVEKHLATDLIKAGITVVLDRWENARIGASVPRFVERVAKCDRVLVVGTPLYRSKYANNQPMRGFVVAAEGDLIGKRMIGTEAHKETVLPVLLEGSEEASFPHLLQGRVYADFRETEAYFGRMFDLLLSLYGIPPQHPVSTQWREALRVEGPGGLV